MSTPTSDTKWTYEEYLLIPDDHLRHEIIDGEEHLSPAPSPRHQEIVASLLAALREYVLRVKAGKVYVAPVDVVLSPHDVVQPDLLFVSTDRLSIIKEERGVFGAPDLAIEVLSEGGRKRDEIVKRRRYEELGVKEYWVIDPELEAVKWYRTTTGKYKLAAQLSREQGDTLSTPMLQGLRVSLEDVFRR